ncbi:MAG: cysteine desulfurase [Deltaproteobacteria bacterium]|jgi:cysteine desulfurase|nr:cysteine desulfurase [Deltaproteobacteria bacterium]
MTRRIYVDNSATSPVSERALKAMLPHFREEFGNPSAIYSLGSSAFKALEDSRRQVAKALGAMSSEIFFTSGGTESDNWAIYDACRSRGRPGGHVVTSSLEHNAVAKPLAKLAAEGHRVTVLRPGPDGQISPGSLEAELTDQTFLVSIMTASNVVGTVLNIKELCAVAHKRGILFHTDAVQAAGHVPVNVRHLGVDLLSISGHKFHGPKGVGALFSKIPRAPVPYIDGGGQEKGSRSGTENVPGIVGMAAALTEAVEALPSSQKYLADLRDRLVEKIQQIPRVQLTGDPINRLPGHASFVIEGLAHGAHLINELNERGVCASSGSACSASSREASTVLTSLNISPELSMNALRLSLSVENTEEEVDLVGEAVTEAVQKVRDLTKAKYYHGH